MNLETVLKDYVYDFSYSYLPTYINSANKVKRVQGRTICKVMFTDIAITYFALKSSKTPIYGKYYYALIPINKIQHAYNFYLLK